MMYRVAGALQSTLAWLRSYRGSVVILSALCLLLAVWLVPFQLTGQSKATVDAIAWGWLPLQVVYVLAGVATTYCTYVRLRRDLRRARSGPRAGTAPSTRSRAMEHAGDLASLAELLSDRGYDVAVTDERIEAVKYRWSALGGSVFHLAVVLFALAVLLQHTFAATGEVRVIEGQSFDEATVGSDAWVSRALTGFSLEAIEPAYFGDVLLFTRLDATLRDAAGARVASSLSRPLWLDPFTHVSVQDYGLAPSFKVTDAAGKVVDEATVALALNPPGARDSVTFPGSGITVSAVAYPDYGVVDGRDVSLSYNLANPWLRLSASRSESGTETARALLGVDDLMRVGDYTVQLTGIARHGTFKLFRTHATLPIAFGSILMLLGLVARLFFPRHDVIVWKQDDGMVVDAWLDAFGREQGIARLDAVLRAGSPR